MDRGSGIGMTSLGGRGSRAGTCCLTGEGGADGRERYEGAVVCLVRYEGAAVDWDFVDGDGEAGDGAGVEDLGISGGGGGGGRGAWR